MEWLTENPVLAERGKWVATLFVPIGRTLETVEDGLGAAHRGSNS